MLRGFAKTYGVNLMNQAFQSVPRTNIFLQPSTPEDKISDGVFLSGNPELSGLRGMSKRCDCHFRCQQAQQANSVYIFCIWSKAISQLMQSIIEYELPLGKKLALHNL